MNLRALVGFGIGNWVDCGFYAVATVSTQSKHVCRLAKWVTRAFDDSSRSRLI